MSIESTNRVIRKYWDSEHSDVSMMAPDVVFTIMADGREAHGPEEVLHMLTYFYQIAFDARAESFNEIVSDGHAVWEGHFTGSHIGEFAGVPATGKEVRIPLCVSYDIKNEQIKAARVYFEIPPLMAQLGVSAAAENA